MHSTGKGASGDLGKGADNTAGDGPAIDQSDAFARATAAAGVERVVDGQVMEVGTSPIRPAAPDPNDQSAAVGKAIWVLFHSPIHKHMFISELEWMLLPPIALKQYRVRVRSGVSVHDACWAHLSDDAEAALKAGVRRVRPPKPGPAAPTSGSSTPSPPSAVATRFWRRSRMRYSVSGL